MTTPLWCLVIVALLPYVLSFTGGYFRMRDLGAIDNKSPRQQIAQLQGVGARVYAAQQNAWEALAFFGAAVLVLHVANPQAAAGGAAANWSLAFLATRIAHPIVYAANQDLLRSGVFTVGLVSVIALFWIAV